MRSLIFFFCLGLFVSSSFAQNSVGTISGVVTDPDRSALSGAAVQAKNAATGTTYKTSSSAKGDYSLGQLPAGTYEVAVAVPGLRPYTKKDILVRAGQTLQVDIRLEDNISLGTLGEDRAFFTSLATPHSVPSGPTPRTPDGKPNLSGVWWSARPADPGSAEQPALLPSAEAIARERAENFLKDSPSARCLPGFSLTLMDGGETKLVQTPTLLVAFSQFEVPGWRQVFLDGRGHPKDQDPTWHGHSIGKWEGDTLVVDTIGFNDKTWLRAARNAPHTEMLHITERIRRPDLGHLEMEITYEDPGTLTKPFKVKEVAELSTTVDIEEYICNENNQDVDHLIGK